MNRLPKDSRLCLSRAFCMLSIALIVVMTLPCASSAQQVDFEKIVAETNITPGAATSRFEDSATQKARLIEFESATGHKIWARDFQRRSWEWHLISTRIVFFLVVSIVVFGLRVTYLQFRKDYLLKDQTAAGEKKAKADGLNSEQQTLTTPEVSDANASGALAAVESGKMKIGLQGLEISSQIVGLLVLGLSLAFFYLYLKEVYPMFQERERKWADDLASSAQTTAGHSIAIDPKKPK